LTENGKNKEDIIQGVKEAKIMFHSKNQLLYSNNFSFEMKKIIIKSCIWIVAIYGSEK
jgi:hypothetical protein